MSDDAVRRARSLVGCRFRAQGRDPATGLDCIGLVCMAFEIPADEVPRDYRLRNPSVDRLGRYLSRFFELSAAAEAGDMILLKVAADQLHLAIRTDRGIVHADAALRKVVERPGMPPWPVISAFRYKAV